MSTPLLHIDRLAIAFRQGERDTRVVDDLSLQVEAGQTLAL